MKITVDYNSCFTRFNGKPDWINPHRRIELEDGSPDQIFRDTMIRVLCQPDAQEAADHCLSFRDLVEYSSMPLQYATNIVVFIFTSENWEGYLSELEDWLKFYCPYFFQT